MSDGVADRLVDTYVRYLGEPERELDVYAGFALFFGGLALGIVGLAVFAVEQSMSGQVFALREVAFSLGALGLPVLLVGVSVLLPVDRRATVVAAAGLVVTLASVGYFTTVYPHRWNVGPGSKTLQGVLFYAAGLSVVVAATAAALVSYHVERTRGAVTVPDAAEEGTGPASGTADRDEEAVAAQVERDVEEAMEDADITWGGVEKTEISRQLSVTDPSEAREDVDTSGFEGGAATERRDAGDTVDDAVEGLKQLRGGEHRVDRGGGTDEQASALRELREKKRADESDEPGLLDRLRAFLTGE